jgi:DNA-binding SARP family transcriptional activator
VSVQVRILGPIEVHGGRISGGRPLSLFALLLVNRGALVPVDKIVDELWEGAGPRHRRKAVHVVASRLRSAVGTDVLRSEPAGYGLRLAPGELDADRFEVLLRRGRAELADGDAREAAATLRRALGLWRGPALAEVAEERFAQPEAARLEDLRLACLSDRIDADLACGRHEELVGELEALVRAHPLRERLRGQHMLALYRSGRQAEALDAYRSAYQALADGLGIEPSPELRALEAAILRHEVPALATPPPARDVLTADARRLVTCVVARLGERPDVDAESRRALLDRFHDAARAVCERHDGAVAEARTDAVLAVFGTPVAHEDDALRALRAATELVAEARRLGACCGVGTGEVVAAARGAVVGAAVDAAERLARAAGEGDVRVDARTWRVVRHAARATELGDGAFRLDGLDREAPAIRRRLDRPLVGRERELRRLGEAFARVAGTGAAELLAIVGEPGIGKSRLAAELGAIAAGGQVLSGRCRPFGEGITYWPLREALAPLKGDRSIDEVGAALGIPPAVVRQAAIAVGLEDGAVAEDAGWAILRVIEAIARIRPLILAIDDAHLAEPALLELLRDVASHLRDAPALIVWVARLDLLDQRHPGWAAHVGPDRVLELGPLSPPATAALLDAVAGGRLDRDEQRRIAAAAGGNPLFLEQLVAYVDERDATPELPPALHALLAARLDRLDGAERAALALGAIVGEAFEVGEVHPLADGVTRAELEEACERLVGRDLLLGGEDGLVRFRHGLVRDVAYASLSKAARARLHERHAAWLDELAGDLPEADARIGFHLETACRYERELGGEAEDRLAQAAGTRLAAAGRLARVRGDLPGEIGFLHRAVALLGADRAPGAELLPALVSALIEAGASARAEVLAHQALSASAALDLPTVGAWAAIERERIRLHRHPESFDVVRAVAVVDRASRTLRAQGDEVGLARADFLMADLTWITGDLVASGVHAERMLDHARLAGSGFDVATALIFVAWCLIEGPWPVPEAVARYDALAGDAAGLRAAELTLIGCRGALTALTGPYDEARGALADAAAGLVEMQLSGTRLYLALLTGLAAMHAGEPEAAEQAAREAEALVTDPGDRWLLSMVQSDLALSILAQDRLAEAAEAVAAMDARPAPCDADWVIKRHMARALLAARRGEPERGLDDARAAIAAAERTDMVVNRANAHRTLAELLAATGDRAGAMAALTRALALHEAKGSLAAAAATRAAFPDLLAA